ncbi:SAM-dependent methyltransferase [Amycolatopsis sp. NPDC051903]|uniref:SAM-dependent methyltransferase n=1 Tax=Amycolatopsis sp. NPDC051903 TaxID=3363936 RepID=UPI0037A1AB6C
MYMSLLRHYESQRPDALFTDPFADVVVAALAGTPELDELAAGHGVAAESLEDRYATPEFRYFPVRTRYFDDRLTAALRGGIRQVVSLAAGLDGRPMRLDCPPGTRWYELDLPELVAFKETLVSRAGIAPTCTLRTVKADLAADWYSGLHEAGFDPRQPTAWLVEGLLMYLPHEAADRLLAELTRVSAPRSELLLEHLAGRMLTTRSGTIHDAVESQDSGFVSARDDLADWLAGHGWRAEVHPGSDPAIGYGRLVPELPAGWLAHAVLDTAG